MMDYNWDYLDKRAYNNRVGHYKFRREYDFICTYGIGHFDKVLDIAGGSGRFALPLLKDQHTTDITLVDRNAEAADLAKERNANIKTITGDFTASKIQDTFTLFICMEALNYFDDWNHFFQQVRSLSAPNGKFIFSYQNPQSWRFFLRKIWHLKSGCQHYYDMPYRQFIHFLRVNGFKIDQMEGMNWIPLPLKSNSRLVGWFEWIEKWLYLHRWLSQSPWILFCVRIADN